MVIMRFAIIGFLLLTLSGCIGSSIFVPDADHDLQFPDLHTVPENASIDLGKIIIEHPTENNKLNELQKKMQENARLRKQYGLSTD